MLALETRTVVDDAVGGNSVTTIPAAAYLGVTIGIGEFGEAPGGGRGAAGMNVLMMSVGAAIALLAQPRGAQRRTGAAP